MSILMKLKRVFIVEQDKQILLQRWLEKAQEALSSSKDNIQSNNLTTAQNRFYQSNFFIH